MEKTVLFISSNKDLQTYANLFLNNGLNDFVFHLAESVSKAVKKLKMLKTCDVIYLGHQLHKDEPLKALSELLIPLINKKQTIFYGTNKAFKGKDWAHYIHEYTPKNKIFLKMHKALVTNNANQDFIPMPLMSLINFEFFPFDCFIRIKKHNKIEHLKIFKQGDEVFFEDVTKYQDKNVSVFYVNATQLEEKLNQLQGKLQEDDAADIEVTSENIDDVHESSLEYVAELLNDVGMEISPENMELTQKSFENSKKLIKETMKKKSHLKDLINKDDLFYYKHITMTSIVCCYLLDSLYLSDEGLKEKLCLAASLHNIFLDKTDELKVDSPD